jgi:glutathione synthase/RimK-type ligase-like ATP-grasp enzyme
MNKKEVLVFFSYRSHKYGYIEMLFDRFVEAARFSRPNLTLYRGSLSDLHIQIKDTHLSITESLTGRNIDTFDLVYFELWYKAQQQALAAARLLERKGVPYFSKEIHEILPMTKVGELAVLADNDIAIPNTFTSSRRETKKAFKNRPPLRFPLIVKAADGYGGKDNYLVRDYGHLVEILDTNKTLRFVIQEFIPNDRDYRCLVIGGEISLVLMRSRDKEKDTHLNNTSAGAVGEVVPVAVLSQEAQAIVIKAAKVLNRSEFAGVDLMLNSETGKPYILEVNQTPQIEIGAEVHKKMDALLSYMSKTIGGNDGK